MLNKQVLWLKKQKLLLENNKIKKNEELTEDERDMCLEIVQEMIEKFNKTVEDKFKEKEIELTSI